MTTVNKTTIVINNKEALDALLPIGSDIRIDFKKKAVAELVKRAMRDTHIKEITKLAEANRVTRSDLSILTKSINEYKQVIKGEHTKTMEEICAKQKRALYEYSSKLRQDFKDSVDNQKEVLKEYAESMEKDTIRCLQQNSFKQLYLEALEVINTDVHKKIKEFNETAVTLIGECKQGKG